MKHWCEVFDLGSSIKAFLYRSSPLRRPDHAALFGYLFGTYDHAGMLRTCGFISCNWEVLPVNLAAARLHLGVICYTPLSPLRPTSSLTDIFGAVYLDPDHVSAIPSVSWAAGRSSAVRGWCVHARSVHTTDCRNPNLIVSYS